MDCIVSLWGLKKSDTPEQLSLHFFTAVIINSEKINTEQEVKVMVSNQSPRPEKSVVPHTSHLLSLAKKEIKIELVFHLMGIIQKATKLWGDK